MSRPPYLSLRIQSTRPGRPPSAGDIVESFVAEHRQGRLPPGSRVPPLRVLERQLGIAKGTVEAAYDELAARGLLEARAREGVFVARAPSPAVPPAPDVSPPLPALRPVPRLFRDAPPKDAVALSTVLIDPDLLPRERMEECVRSVIRERPPSAVAADFAGYRPLREAIAARLSRRGIAVSPEQVITTVGSQQAIDLVARALEVRRAAVENPVYPHARLLLKRHDIALTPLRLDPFSDVPLDDWAQALESARPGVLYAITSFQNPSGYCYSTGELTRLLELARRFEVPLFEDDWGSDMLSDSEYRPTLRALGGSHVLYANSFTKKLMPSLRVGYLVADEALVPALVAAKRLSTLATPLLPEAALFEFLDRGYYDTHLAALQAELDRRYEACLEALRALMPDDVRWTTPGGGPTLWLDLPRRVDLQALRSRLLARGVYVEDASPAFFGEPHLHGFRVSYAYVKPQPLARALEVLAAELRASGC